MTSLACQSMSRLDQNVKLDYCLAGTGTVLLLHLSDRVDTWPEAPEHNCECLYNIV